MHLKRYGADEGNGAIERPSRAFCKAIDNEQELDSNDLLANGATHPIADAEQPFRTQVGSAQMYSKGILRGSQSHCIALFGIFLVFKPAL